MTTLNRKRFSFLLVLLALLAGFVLVGCSSGGTESESAAATDSNAVTDVVWQSESLTEQPSQEKLPSPTRKFTR